MINIILTSILVDDQDKALGFYTSILGFQKKTDITMGVYRWLTVVAANNSVELVLEPMAFAPAKTYQKALFDAGIPSTVLGTDDIQKEYAGLTALGVVFRSAPKAMGPVTMALFEDTCGNLINLVQQT